MIVVRKDDNESFGVLTLQESRPALSYVHQTFVFGRSGKTKSQSMRFCFGEQKRGSEGVNFASQNSLNYFSVDN